MSPHRRCQLSSNVRPTRGNSFGTRSSRQDRSVMPRTSGARFPRPGALVSAARLSAGVEIRAIKPGSAEREASWPTDEEFMRQSVLRTAAGQATVAASHHPGGGWTVTATGSSIFHASIGFVQRRGGNSNPQRLQLPCQVAPNPSFKLRPNGKSPSPVWRYAVHFRQPGLGAVRPHKET